MSDMQCPTEAELVAFADADLTPERLNRIAHHLKQCSACAKVVASLKLLMEDVAALAPESGKPGSPTQLDVSEHVAGVMRRLDEPGQRTRVSRWTLWSGGLAAAAAAALGIALSRGPDVAAGSFAARGGMEEASLARDFGVQLYAQEQSLRALESGARIRSDVALTAGLRNLGSEPAYLLLFGVDARRVVHWLTPEFTTPGSNPEATSVAPSSTERLLSNAAVFDDLAPGPLHVVAVITRKPTHVSEVEALSGEELGAEGLMKHFPQAEVRQFLLEVAPAPGASP
jgi:hypothetical protein